MSSAVLGLVLLAIAISWAALTPDSALGDEPPPETYIAHLVGDDSTPQGQAVVKAGPGDFDSLGGWVAPSMEGLLRVELEVVEAGGYSRVIFSFEYDARDNVTDDGPWTVLDAATASEARAAINDHALYVNVWRVEDSTYRIRGELENTQSIGALPPRR